MTTKKLACGGKGPCCHVGYSHRHCEHCDVVVATYAPYQLVPRWQYYPQYSWAGTSTLPQQLSGGQLSNLPGNKLMNGDH